MKIKITITIIFLITATLAATANLRAPYRLVYTSGGALNPVAGLTVLNEKLKFHINQYPSGKISEVVQKKYTCTVYAAYSIHSESTASLSFEFISPSAESITVKINGASVQSRTEPIVKDNDTGNWNRYVKTSYSIKFSGDLKQNINGIEVTYTQPLSIHETAYGYFTKSRYLASAGYEFWPLKEWKLDKNFKAEIEITAPYDWGITDSVFGQDITLEMKGYTKDMKNIIETVNGPYSHEKGILRRNCSLSATIPDILYIYVTEK